MREVLPGLSPWRRRAVSLPSEPRATDGGGNTSHTLKSSRWGRGAVSRWVADFQFPGCGLPGQSELRLKTSSWKREAQTKKNAGSVFLFTPQRNSSTHVKSHVRLRTGSAGDFSPPPSQFLMSKQTSVNINPISHGHKSDKCRINQINVHVSIVHPGLQMIYVVVMSGGQTKLTQVMPSLSQHLLWHHKGLVSKTGS